MVGETHTGISDAGYALLRTAFGELFSASRYNGNSARTVIERQQRTQRGSNSSNGGGLIALGRNHRGNNHRGTEDEGTLFSTAARSSKVVYKREGQERRWPPITPGRSEATLRLLSSHYSSGSTEIVDRYGSVDLLAFSLANTRIIL